MYVLPLKAFNVVGDCDKGGESRIFQQLMEKMKVDAPSSIIVWRTFLLRAFTFIRKAKSTSNCGVYPAWLKTTRFESVGSIPPIVDNKACF